MLALKLGRTLAFFVTTVPVFCGDWDVRLSAQYLDSRQKAWFEWKAAAAPGGPCVSCHTGLTYLQVRPALRHALGESVPTSYETGLLDGLRARLQNPSPGGMFPRIVKEPLASQAASAEALIAAVVLTSEADGAKALDRMWSLQLHEGKNKGAWSWFSLGLSPWECPEATFYGATLAAKALGDASSEYRKRADVREHAGELNQYFQREYATQPLHHRLTFLWMASKLTDVLPADARKQTVDETWKKQRPDGSWSIASLGPWATHSRASDGSNSDSYATALAVLATQKTGTPRNDARLVRALGWLKSHQEAESGSWASDSMNKTYPPDSMQTNFMREAATAYAALALLDGKSVDATR